MVPTSDEIMEEADVVILRSSLGNFPLLQSRAKNMYNHLPHSHCSASITSNSWWFLVAQTVKYLPAMQETPIQFLGREDPLEKGMATHSSILAWRILWTEEPGGLQSIGLPRVGHDWMTNSHFHMVSIVSFIQFYSPSPLKYFEANN